MAKTVIDYIWKDRKRFLGLPLSFTRYAMCEDRLFMSVGFLNIKDEEILLYRIRDIETKRTLGQRMLGVGTVIVSSADKTTPVLELKNIKDPVAVKEMLHHSVEEQKIRRKVRLGEVMGSADHTCCHDDNDMDDMEDDNDPDDTLD